MTKTLALGSVARLWSFHHHKDEPHVDPAEESVSQASIIFTAGGTWAFRSERDRLDVTPKKVLLLNAGQPYSCTHEGHFPGDRTLCLEIGAPGHFRFDRTWVSFSPRWASVLTWMSREERAAEPGYQLAIDALASSLVVDVARHPHSAKSLPERVETARTFLELNWRSDIGLKDLARAASTSPFHLTREFKRLVGESPRQYLIGVRMKEAKVLLRDTAMTVTEVGHACGFNSASHFSTTFRTRMGLTPLEFRRS